MKIYLDARNELTKGYLGKRGYAELGYNTRPVLIHSREYDKTTIDNNMIIDYCSNYEFALLDDCDLVLYIPKLGEDENNAYLIDEDTIDKLRKKTVVKSLSLNDEYINRFHPLIFMFCFSAIEIFIGEQTKEICSDRNAFENCNNLCTINVAPGNKIYFSRPINNCYGMPNIFSKVLMNSLFERTYIDENGYTYNNVLHTFPCGNVSTNNEIWFLFTECIRKNSFIGELRCEFLYISKIMKIEYDIYPYVKNHTILIIDDEICTSELLNWLSSSHIMWCTNPYLKQKENEIGKDSALQQVKNHFYNFNSLKKAFK